MSKSETEDLRRRLSRLGRRRGSSRPTELDSTGSHRKRGLPPGELVETPFGQAYRIERRYPLQFEHGISKLGDLLQFDEERRLAAEVARQDQLRETPLASLAYLDTETTGLAGGAGTLVFLVGLGRFQGDSFVLRQYLLRDPAEEGSMLHALRKDLETTAGFVTFNGRSFDVPLLEMRYVIGLRERWRLTGWPHLDLLYPARRLWSRTLPDCRLATLESSILKIERTEADVPGAEIPELYLNYLRSGDGSELQRVVYHNQVDILSLVGLTREIISRHGAVDPSGLSGAEALAVGRWHEGAGRPEPAEEAYQKAVDGEADGEIRTEALRRLGIQLRRQDRYKEAVEVWQVWHDLAEDDPRPSVELAKYHEWKTKELGEALKWAKRALVKLTHWPEGWRREKEWEEIEHRVSRLKRKLAVEGE